MPIYEFKCQNCNHCFEKIVFANDAEPIACPECDHKKVKKLLSCTHMIGTSGFNSCAPGSGAGFS